MSLEIHAGAFIHVDNQKIMCRQQTTVLWANTNYTCRKDLSVCCPCWFRIWQLNCQNNFLAFGSAGGISIKIATKFNIVGSILFWYIHMNTFLARAIIKLTVFRCRFATMSPEMHEMEHGGCRIASPARAVRALFRLESWATRAGEVDRGTSASSRMTGSAPSSPGYLCHIGAEPTTNCNSNETYVILFQIYPCIT